MTLLVGRQKGHPACKNEWCGTGMVICLELDADLHMVQLMPLPLSFSKNQIGFTFSYRLTQVVPDKRPLKMGVWLCITVLTYTHTHTHTHTFNGPFSGTTQVSQYQKGKTNLDFTEARDSEWQWHQQGHMQVYTLLQTENHTSTPPLCFLQAGCPSCRPTNGVKALKAKVLT